jgi:hypothetical protein
MVRVLGGADRTNQTTVRMQRAMMNIAIALATVLLKPKVSLSVETIGAGGATCTFERFIFMIMDDARQS